MVVVFFKVVWGMLVDDMIELDFKVFGFEKEGEVFIE